jgi:YjbE family integral membrane protein
MEFFSPEFFTALVAIVLIDLVLAGDNAIVIALAARRLPEHLRKKAVLWGAVGAIAVRSVMTLAVVWLLQIPGLLAIGGILLLWIAYKLLVNDDHVDENKVKASATFIGAMKTIVVADMVMGVDNVLAVAGAAHGSFLLVVLGLLISIPIVIWGSSIILKYTERFPSIVYIGGAVLAWTAVKMTLSEPLVKPYIPESMAIVGLIYALVVGTVLFLGFSRNQVRSVRSAEATHAEKFSNAPVINAPINALVEGVAAMEKVLVPIDGSTNALAAVRTVAEAYRKNPTQEIVLLNVQPTFHHHISRFVSRSARDSYRTEQAERALKGAKDLLARFNVPFQSFVAQGDRAEAINAFAEQSGCNRIVIGTARKNSLTRLVQSSVVAKLLEDAKMPVQVVVGAQASRLERFGIPAGLGAAVAALVIAD